MATLPSLPLDIQHHILSYLLSPRDIASLSTQCKTLHRLCDMSTRHKYHSVKIEPSTDSIDTAFTLLMDILRRPVLGRYIRHIEVRAAPPRRVRYTQLEPQREISEGDMRLLRGAVKNAGFGDLDLEGQVVNMLLQRMDYGTTYSGDCKMADKVFAPQALGALLVSVSPFLETMAMTPMATHDYTFSGSAPAPKVTYPLDYLLRSVNSDPTKQFPYLQNLRDVYIINNPDGHWDDERFYISMDLFTPISTICNLPSIELVRTDIVEEDENGLRMLEFQSSDITKITMHHSSVSSSYLVSLICSCKTLKDLAYSVGGRATNDGGYPIFNPKTVIRALLYHKSTLETLDLDVESYIYHFGPGVDEADAIEEFDNHESVDDEGYGRNPPEGFRDNKGALRDFSRLKRLSIGVGFLLYFAWGIDVTAADLGIEEGVTRHVNTQVNLVTALPPNLEYLCIRGYKKGEVPARDAVIEELVEAVRAGRLQLEVVGVEEMIPNAENVDDPDGNPHLLWKPDGYESEGYTDDEDGGDEE
ncbi:hypothetical protein BJX65DRAFT_264230 [Aspergillus insuetus]